MKVVAGKWFAAAGGQTGDGIAFSRDRHGKT
jgi:hypothetical protein